MSNLVSNWFVQKQLSQYLHCILQLNEYKVYIITLGSNHLSTKKVERYGFLSESDFSSSTLSIKLSISKYITFRYYREILDSKYFCFVLSLNRFFSLKFGIRIKKNFGKSHNPHPLEFKWSFPLRIMLA